MAGSISPQGYTDQDMDAWLALHAVINGQDAPLEELLPDAVFDYVFGNSAIEEEELANVLMEMGIKTWPVPTNDPIAFRVWLATLLDRQWFGIHRKVSQGKMFENEFCPDLEVPTEDPRDPNQACYRDIVAHDCQWAIDDERWYTEGGGARDTAREIAKLLDQTWNYMRAGNALRFRGTGKWESRHLCVGSADEPDCLLAKAMQVTETDIDPTEGYDGVCSDDLETPCRRFNIPSDCPGALNICINEFNYDGVCSKQPGIPCRTLHVPPDCSLRPLSNVCVEEGTSGDWTDVSWIQQIWQRKGDGALTFSTAWWFESTAPERDCPNVTPNVETEGGDPYEGADDHARLFDLVLDTSSDEAQDRAEMLIDMLVTAFITEAGVQMRIDLDECSEGGRYLVKDVRLDKNRDSDHDGVEDQDDNCPNRFNPLQLDFDDDGTGNACDPDADNDGVDNEVDNCRLIPNPFQLDTDGDGRGDVCDTGDGGSPEIDFDGDLVGDGIDNCPLIPNPDQADNEADGVGDICDPDDDNDAAADIVDNCPLVFNVDQEDSDANGIGDACELIATPTPTPAPTPTATPAPENECQCVPHRVVPRRNLASLRKTTEGGRGSTATKKVGVVLKAQERTPGACRPGSSTDTFSLRLQMVDDDGDVILDETRTGTCDRRVRQEKFMAPYDVVNCAGSEPPSRRSKGEVTVTATTEDGELIASRILKCSK